VKEDSELLTGVFVVQLGFGSAAQVMAAAAEWATRRGDGLSLSDVLMQRGLLDADKRKMVEALSGRALQVNDGDVGRTLQSLSTGLNGLMKSLSSSFTGHDTRPSQTTSQTDSLEGSENISDEPIGRYDFETGPHGSTQELGRGGIGRVIVVNDRFLGRDVAMKELLQEHTSNPQVATTRTVALEQRFLREARLTGQLEHPAIVPVYELGRRLDGGLYYTMQRVRGRTLFDLLRTAKTLEGRLKHLGAYLTVCRAIAYAHSRAVVHRDIKPQNVMVGAFGETYVLDWGLARVKGKKDPRAKDLKLQPDITGNVLEGGAIGTPSYMSPEQASGKVELIDERSDVWCLGAVLYEMLTGQPPYIGSNPFEVLGKIGKDPIVPVRELEKEAPLELIAIVEKALQFEREERYRNAEDMARDVESWLGGGRVAAHEYRSWELIQRFARRNRVVLAVASAALVLFVALGVVSYRQVRRQRDEAQAFAQLFLEDVSDKLAPIAGSTPLVEQLTHRTLDYYRNNVDPRRGPRDERLRLTAAWNKIGRLAYDVDRYDEAVSAFDFARQVAERLVEEDPNEPRALVSLSAARVGASDVKLQRGEVDTAHAGFQQAAGLAERAVAAFPNDLDALDALSRAHNRIGELLMASGRFSEALEPIQKSVEVDRRIAALQGDTDDAVVNLAISTRSFAHLLERNGRLAEARKLNDEATAMALKVVQRSPQEARAMRAASDSSLEQAALARLRHDEAAWRVAVERAYTYAEMLVKKEPSDSVGRYNLAMAEVQLGRSDAAYARFVAGGEAAAYTSDNVEAFALAMFHSGRYSELVAASARAPGTAVRSVCTLAALAAALKGDARESARLATVAANAQGSDLRWLVDAQTQRLEGDGPPLRHAALALAKRLDETQPAADGAVVKQILLDYAKTVSGL
jgi:tRNA A-37 threonylcarbamoyl transferase component Bud32/tetratricopeptide (TPR) repeat protein